MSVVTASTSHGQSHLRTVWLPAIMVSVIATVAACSSATSQAPSSTSNLASSAASSDLRTPRSLPPSPSAPGSASADWSLVALGDSVVSEGASDHSSYPDRYAIAIEKLTGKSVHVTSFARGTSTSDSVLSVLQSADSYVVKAVVAADIITITVGGNDADPTGTYPSGTCAPGTSGPVCLDAYNPRLESNLQGILTKITTLRGGKPTVVRLTSPDYNPFIGWDGAPSPTFGADFYRQVASAETELVCTIAAKNGAVCADFYHAFNGADGTRDAKSLLNPDHLHPSLKGRQVIADALIKTGLAPLN